ncbi:type IV pilus modification PilV family protein [Desulfurivibrio alkaliphilus]|nr:prepilin-type N-terminal cleavage/methylation domain-containing protein [Desulfurivibrio alkaliphilus]
MNRATQQEGFTLIEVLIAITLLAVGILAAGSMQISALGGNHLAMRITTASSLAGSTIEEMMRREYDDPALDATLDPNEGDYDPEDAASLNNALNNLEHADIATWPSEVEGFEIFYHVAEDYPLPDNKTIRVTVRRDDRGVLRTVALDYIKMQF